MQSLSYACNYPFLNKQIFTRFQFITTKHSGSSLIELFKTITSQKTTVFIPNILNNSTYDKKNFLILLRLTFVLSPFLSHPSLSLMLLLFSFLRLTPCFAIPPNFFRHVHIRKQLLLKHSHIHFIIYVFLFIHCRANENVWSHSLFFILCSLILASPSSSNFTLYLSSP